ncbi:MAG: hypothetical protein IJ250_05585 [Bacteroidales bacterium]|nr:hypothetical protein [Bacteroidales bacterium]
MMQNKNYTDNSALSGDKQEQPTDRVLQELNFEEDFKRLKNVWNKQNAIPADMNWGKIFSRRRPKFYYKGLFIWKWILLLCYILILADLLQDIRICSVGMYAVPYAVVVLICCFNLWWYTLYILRIRGIDIYNDSTGRIGEKKSMLLLMEKYELIGSLLLLPVYIITYFPILYYVDKQQDIYPTIWDMFIDYLPIVFFAVIGGGIYYLCNRYVIKQLKKEVDNKNKLLTINIFKLWIPKMIYN